MEKFTVVDVDQGSQEWFDARLGNITASNFSSIMTASGKLSASAEKVVNIAVAEKIMGYPEETFQSPAMARGSELEGDALAFFNFTHDYNFEQVGFLDSGLGYGCSPDGIDLKARVGLEMKCPSAHQHLAYLGAGILPKIYVGQVQGSLLISGFDTWIFSSYHPNLPCFHIEVKRDELYIKHLESHLLKCAHDVKTKYANLQQILSCEGSK